MLPNDLDDSLQYADRRRLLCRLLGEESTTNAYTSEAAVRSALCPPIVRGMRSGVPKAALGIQSATARRSAQILLLIVLLRPVRSIQNDRPWLAGRTVKRIIHIKRDDEAFLRMEKEAHEDDGGRGSC